MIPSKPMNKFLVGARGDEIVILNLPITAYRVEGSMPKWPVPGPLSPDEALNLAAWLVAVTGKRDAFFELLAAVEAT